MKNTFERTIRPFRTSSESNDATEIEHRFSFSSLLRYYPSLISILIKQKIFFSSRHLVQHTGSLFHSELVNDLVFALVNTRMSDLGTREKSRDSDSTSCFSLLFALAFLVLISKYRLVNLFVVSCTIKPDVFLLLFCRSNA